MANEKMISAISTIERALGIIEGVACGITTAGADMLITAVEMIESATKEITDGK
jgi:hypothetical protein